MDQYSDIRIIEANRLHSEEAKGGNNENTSLWTNNLQDILHLSPKDKVSIYGAFISERGAGQQSSIEIKGQELGQSRPFEYIKIEGEQKTDANSQQFKIIKAVFTRHNYQLRDDNLRFTISYYIPSSAMNCLQLPRRWVYYYRGPDSSKTTSFRLNWTDADSRLIGGASLTEYRDQTKTALAPMIDFYYRCMKNSAGERLDKFKNDNQRFTLLVRKQTNLEATGTLEPQDMRDPENSDYYVYKELKEFKVPAGFNSAQFVATEITRQLQEIVSDRKIIQYEAMTEDLVYHPLEISRILESQTYKAFKTWNVTDGTLDNFLEYFNLSTANGSHTRTGWSNLSGHAWLSQYQVVATKYPELYQTGRLLNRTGTGQVYQGIKGTYLRETVQQTLAGWKLDIPYNQARCDEFKAFFDAQKLYPEIIEALNVSFFDTGYTQGNSLENTRWIHSNIYSNASMYLGTGTASVSNTQLGWGGYYQPRKGWNASGKSLQSGLLCLFFNEGDQDTFYDNPNTDDMGEYTYGCLGRSSDNFIMIYPNRHIHNGVGTHAYNKFFQSGEVEAGRKMGFDLHFNAPGMFYLSPMSGHSIHTNDKSSLGDKIGNYIVPGPEISGVQTADPEVQIPRFDTNKYKDLLYIGADNPSLEWDGTHFGFKGLHTGLNRGNFSDAGEPQVPSVGVNEDASDVVYKINPPEYYMDWTPDRTPYRWDGYNLCSYITWDENGSDTGNKFSVPRVNDNLEKGKVYDMLGGIFIEDYGVDEDLWDNSLWGLLGFTYEQFHGTNTRLTRIQSGNSNQLSKLTTNAEVVEGDTKIYATNWAGTPLYNNMIMGPVNIMGFDKDNGSYIQDCSVYPSVIHKTQSITILAQNLPTRMIRGYYTIRSNIMEGNPFTGGKVNNTTMPVIGIVDKINGDGDFYFGQEGSLQFTITKPLRLASLTVSVHDPDGSYARTSDQSTILFKVQKPVETMFNVAEQIFQENKNDPILKKLNQ